MNVSGTKRVKNLRNFFLNDEKLHGLLRKIHKIIIDSKEITSNSKIRKEFEITIKRFLKITIQIIFLS